MPQICPARCSVSNAGYDAPLAPHAVFGTHPNPHNPKTALSSASLPLLGLCQHVAPIRFLDHVAARVAAIASQQRAFGHPAVRGRGSRVPISISLVPSLKSHLARLAPERCRTWMSRFGWHLPTPHGSANPYRSSAPASFADVRSQATAQRLSCR